jgi:pSer/pThr/pTyr-binding forkhead associated (FHA) protein
MAPPRRPSATATGSRTLRQGSGTHAGEGLPVRQFAIRVVEGTDSGSGATPKGDRCQIGSHPSNDLVLQDPTVSRFHCEIVIDKLGARVRDLASTNGTILDGAPIVEGFLRGDSTVRVGKSVLRFQFGHETHRLPVSPKTEFGSLSGTSIAMRSVFAVLERAAQSDATVLLEGETGTGKGQAASSFWRPSCSPSSCASSRTVSCGGSAPTRCTPWTCASSRRPTATCGRR